MPGENATRAVEWLHAEGYKVEPRFEAGFASFYAVTDPGDTSGPVTVGQRETDGHVLATTGVKVSEGDRGRLAGIPPENQVSMLRDLAWMVNGHGLTYQLDHDDGVLKGLVFGAQIFEDGLTKDRIVNLMRLLLGQRKLVSLRVAEALVAGDAPAKAPSAPPRARRAARPPTTCLQCSTANRPGAKFCSACGSKLA